MTFSITEVIYWNDNQSSFRDLFYIVLRSLETERNEIEKMMTRKMKTAEMFGIGYAIKPPRMMLPDSFEGKISKKNKMLFRTPKKALETYISQIVFFTLSSFSAFVFSFQFSSFLSFLFRFFFKFSPSFQRTAKIRCERNDRKMHQQSVYLNSITGDTYAETR